MREIAGPKIAGAAGGQCSLESTVKHFDHSIGRRIIAGCVDMACTDEVRERSKEMTLRLTSTITCND